MMNHMNYENNAAVSDFGGKKNVMMFVYRPQKVIWHGAKMDSIDTNCENWHSSTPEKVGLGSSLLGNKLLDQGKNELLMFILNKNIKTREDVFSIINLML